MRTMSSGKPDDRVAMDRQPDLFDMQGRIRARQGRPAAPADAGPSVAGLSDEELVAMIPQADLSTVEALGAEAASRSLEPAVPALEGLWRRFEGFGIETPLLEQRVVLGTLAQMEGGGARTALKRIVMSRSLPGSLLADALRAAANAGLALPAAFVAPLLGHEDATVRMRAFELSVGAGVPGHALRDGLSDLSASVRRSAAIAMGARGDDAARELLLDELARQPSYEVIEALAAIWDEDIVVHLGRLAERQPGYRNAVLGVLHDIETPKARRVAQRLDGETLGSGAGGTGDRPGAGNEVGSAARGAGLRRRGSEGP